MNNLKMGRLSEELVNHLLIEHVTLHMVYMPSTRAPGHVLSREAFFVPFQKM